MYVNEICCIESPSLLKPTLTDGVLDKPPTRNFTSRVRALALGQTSPHLKIPLHLLPNAPFQSSIRPYSSASSKPPTTHTSTTNKLTHLAPSGSAHMVSISSKNITSRTAVAVCSLFFSNPTALPLIKSNSMKKGDVLSVARIAGIMAAKRTSDLIPLCHPIAISHVSVQLDVVDVEMQKGAEEEHKREVMSIPWAGTGQGDAYAWHGTRALPLGLDHKPRSSSNPSSPLTYSQSSTSPKDPGESSRKEKDEYGKIHITATVSCDGKTGVEMEALTAASVAAMAVYDMCKAVDKGMVIEGLRVVRKEGGKSGTWIYGEGHSS